MSTTAIPHGTGETTHRTALPHVAKEYLHEIQGVDEADGAGGETKEITSALAQFNDARNAPGFALQGGYTAAVDHIRDMTSTGGAWDEVSDVPYNSDDQRYRDYYANTTAGGGFVTGRVQALAAGGDYLFVAGATGGVYRKDVAQNGPWTPISDVSGGVPALSSGALAYVASRDELWYATGDGSTGATTYTGDGVWVAKHASTTPVWTHLSDGDAAPGQTGTRKNLFDGAVIQQVRFNKAGTWAYAPSSFGLWRHSTTDLNANWQPVFVPNPSALPGDTPTGTHSTDNYVTDVALDPANDGHLVVALGWVAGGADNGWYDGRYDAGKQSWTFAKSNVTGSINPKDIGRTTFARGQKKLYALVHNPDHATQGKSYSELGGIYVSNSGSVSGPWSKIADSHKLAQAGSALDPTVKHAGAVNPGYQPGVQAWYNQFLAVDPTNDDHVFAGLEEVYETRNSGANWTTPGPYWNFFFSCWGSDPNADQLGCPSTTHSDQHAVAIANGRLYVGNDGGLYTRPVSGKADSSGHATDWQSLSAPQSGTPDFLQYYAVGIGKVDPGKAAAIMGTRAYDHNGVVVSGGLQDNGGSILFTGASSEKAMGSNFGGDGGDVLVDPNDGCRIVQEYVDLAMRVTNVCAAATGTASFTDLSKAHTRSIAPPETTARFTARFAADHKNIDNWLAGGQHVWLNTKGFNIASGKDWRELVDLGTNTAGTAARTATAVASDDGDAIVPFCGSCNAGGAFESGYAVGKATAAALGDTSANHGWKVATTGDANVVDAGGKVVGTLPNRMISGSDVYHDTTGQVHYLLAFNGFSRHWVEGPGAGVGHLFESTDGVTWHDWSNGSDASASLPDVPANTVKYVGDGRIALGTDFGAFLRDADGNWARLGTGLPATVVNDLEPGPAGDDHLYAATYGRGIWKLATPTVHYAGGNASQDDWWNANKPAGAATNP
ncbi:glycosyl hydrolase [Actinopolymorpha rutila]|uniref:Glycosyl hydrolase n=1 Tax=Actinopolymorpha rutila TaxID=446787 RepID=A0A852ZGQ8_9ACTN|nr:glycosyl hydrolase [Actinopolymorpha rutila]NYH91345.1 hypothetical protein [Actinopolymorpha rutila]